MESSSTAYDVIVVGGGTAGVVAALAAARNGAHTLLIERLGFLGGSASGGYVPIFNKTHSATGERIVGGIPLEIFERLMGLGGTTGYYSSNYPGEELPGTHRYAGLPFHFEIFKHLLDVMMEEAGVQLLFHTFTFNALMNGNDIQGVTVANKAGRQEIRGRVIIDCTGDGDIAAWAGAPYEMDSEETLNHGSLIFRLGGVNVPAIVVYMKAHSDQFNWGTNPYVPSLRPEQIGPETPPVFIFGFPDQVKQAQQAGDYVGRSHVVINLQQHVSPRMKGVVTFNSVDLAVNTTNPIAWSWAEVEARKYLALLVKFCTKYLPGFEQAYLLDAATNVTPRETRRIMGDYVFTAEDAIGQRRFPDVIGKGASSVNVHQGPYSGPWDVQHVPGTYDLPYRCLVPRRIDDLLVAGRCISTTHEGMQAIRSMCPCMVTGQAAGTAAAIAVRDHVTPRHVPITALQTLLREQGAILETKD